jgi:hypothetical protein
MNSQNYISFICDYFVNRQKEEIIVINNAYYCIYRFVK